MILLKARRFYRQCQEASSIDEHVMTALAARYSEIL